MSGVGFGFTEATDGASHSRSNARVGQAGFEGIRSVHQTSQASFGFDGHVVPSQDANKPVSLSLT